MAKCNKCGSEIKWVNSEKGWVSYDPDSETPHWEACKRILYKGPLMIVGKTITGSKYYDCHCDCGTPPWEVCKHSFV